MKYNGGSMTDDATPAKVRLTDGLGADANMLACDPYNLDFVLMPLVRMLAEMQLSWSDREQIAHAIIATTAHYKSMTDEMQIHAQGVAVSDERHTMSYATTLATVIHTKHYPEVTQWEPLPDLLGVLTQIDNMTTGLTRANPHE